MGVAASQSDLDGIWQSPSAVFKSAVAPKYNHRDVYSKVEAFYITATEEQLN